MKFMRAVLWVMLIGAFVGFGTTFAVESAYTARAQKVQLVRIDKTKNSRFGPIPIDIGNPTVLILDDESAFLKNKTGTGLPMVDADILKAHGDEPLQLSAIQSIIGLARLGGLFSFIVAAVGLILLARIQGFVVPPEP